MITITGASGKLGRAVAHELGKRVDSTGHAGQPDAGKYRRPAQAGFVTAVADFEQPETLRELFGGTQTALIICGHGDNESASGST